MTPEAQRIAIAESVGFVQTFGRPLPDYLNDLNAMHEILGKLHRDLRGIFIKNLEKILVRDSVYHAIDMDWEACNATASQRAEAYLRTIGKWTDNN
jgi:hypothetical protein